MSKKKPLNIDFSKEREIGYERVYSRLPLLTNLGAVWDGVTNAYDNQPPHETPEVVAPQIGVAIFTQVPEAIQYEQTLDGRLYCKQVCSGDIVITPSNTGTRARWNKTFGTILLGFEPLVFKRTIYESLSFSFWWLIRYISIANVVRENERNFSLTLGIVNNDSP